MSRVLGKVTSVLAVLVTLAALSMSLVGTAQADHRHGARYGGGISGGYSGGYGGGYSGGYRAGYGAPATHHHHGPNCGCGCRSQHHHSGYRGGVVVPSAPYGGYQPLPPVYGPAPHGGLGIYGRHFNFSFGY